MIKVGDILKSNKCGDYIVTAYLDSKNISIEFIATGFKSIVQAKHIRDGQIKDALCPSVCDVGYLGVGRHRVTDGRGRQSKKYQCWASMLRRCYSSKRHKRGVTYIDCTVSSIWHSFQNFGDWFDENYVDGWHLDKDILIKGNKTYSPEACCFVPMEINELFTKTDSLRGNLPIGVAYDANRNKYKASIKINSKNVHIGNYDSMNDAFVAYKIVKEENIKRMADMWGDKINDKIYNAMINYAVEIDD